MKPPDRLNQKITLIHSIFSFHITIQCYITIASHLKRILAILASLSAALQPTSANYFNFQKYKQIHLFAKQI